MVNPLEFYRRFYYKILLSLIEYYLDHGNSVLASYLRSRNNRTGSFFISNSTIINILEIHGRWRFPLPGRSPLFHACNSVIGAIIHELWLRGYDTEIYYFPPY